MYKPKLVILILCMTWLVSLIVGVSALPRTAEAESILPKQLYLIQDTEIYNHPSNRYLAWEEVD
jgi:hypothetical protein